MKKILFAFILFTSIALSQTYYGVNNKATFDGTVKWVSLSEQVTINVKEGKAEWFVTGYDSDLKFLVSKQLSVSYTGQSITVAAQKIATASKFNLTYNGQEQ